MRDRIIGTTFFGLLCLICCWRLVTHVRRQSSKDRIAVHTALAFACLINGLRHAHLSLHQSWKIGLICASTAHLLLFCCVCHVVHFWNRTINEGAITHARTNLSLYPLLFATIVNFATSLIFILRGLQCSAPAILIFVRQPVFLVFVSGQTLAFTILLGTTVSSAWQLRKRMNRLSFVNHNAKRKLNVAVFGIVFAYLTLGIANALQQMHQCIYFSSILPFGSIVVCNLYLLRRVKNNILKTAVSPP